MSEQKRRHKRKKISGKSFIILPVIFFISIYLILYIVLAPSCLTLIRAAGLFFSDDEKNYSTEYNSIFVPISDEEELPAKKDEKPENKKQYVDINDIEYPKYGEHFAQLIIDDCSIDAKLFMGDGDIALRNGVGIYYGSHIPGYGSTILVAGHNNTIFNGLKNAEKGQKVTIKTNYGNYTYEITETAVKKASDRTAFDLTADEENLIMYTCYPFDELGLTQNRFFVYAKFISGPIITDNDKEVM